MPIDQDRILALTATSTIAWTPKSTALYALGVGLGRDPMDMAGLRYVAVEPLRTLPSMIASLLIGHGIGAKQMGVKFRAIVHAAQRVTVPKPLPDHGRARVSTSIIAVHDNGEDKGATIVARSEVADEASGEQIATAEIEILARADGGFGGLPPVREPWRRPDRAPDQVSAFDVHPNQAILFRLSGDTNPLHVNPEVACAAGFERPILQGLCSYGMACAAVRNLTGDNDSGLDFGARFSAPVFPGDRLLVELWRVGDDIRFEGRVPQRDSVVLKQGRATILA